MELSHEELKRAEDRILSILRASPSPCPPLDLLGRLKNEDVSEFVARAAIWYLIDRDEVELTWDRRLQPAKRARDEDRLEHAAQR